jgi:LysM repeat protein
MKRCKQLRSTKFDLELLAITDSNVSATGYQPSTTTSSPPPSTPTIACQPSPSAPIRPGTIPNCCQYHVIVSGDYCYVIEQEYGISFAVFQALNPGIDSGCSNLILGSA